MKRRWKITVGLAMAGLFCAFLLMRPSNGAQRALEETRRSLRQQGFKVELAEFDLSASPELRARAAALTNAAPFTVPRSGADASRRSAVLQSIPDLTAIAGSNAALVIWKQEQLTSDSGEELWPALRETFDDQRAELDAACEAALSGPIRFNLLASQGHSMLLPHLAALKNLSRALAARAVVELHNGNKDAAWTNLLSSTRLVTAWDPEPVEISHLVRFACAAIAFNVAWQTLQADGWADERLGDLQREWESVDFFGKLPETVAFARASAVAVCQLERKQPQSFGMTLKDAVSSPRSAWSALNDYWRRARYRRYGSYEDERALLLHYRDRELELRRAVQCSTWSEMRPLPGITNVIPFQSKNPSGMISLMNLRQINLAWYLYAQGQGPGYGQGWLGRAAEAEARRRIVITAIALERYRSRHGSYPKTLPELVPERLKSPPVDFLDGQPLRYRLTDDGHFVLYSVGLDGTDDGGKMPALARREIPNPTRGGIRNQQGADLVWPRPASATEAANFHLEQRKARAEMADRAEEIQAEAQWLRAATRQAKVETLLASGAGARSTEPTHRGRPLSEVLRNKDSTGTNRLTLDELLTLKQVTTGEEPETVTFEAPINYDVLTNLGSLHLYIDPVPDEDSDEGCEAGQWECYRATNGNCLLVWRTIYESPGKHALQMGMLLEQPPKTGEDIVGPVAPFAVSNLCQFSLSSAYFNPEFGATLRAKLPESNGTYSIQITSPAGERLKTITGSTSNGIIKVHWDLTDDYGRKCTNAAFGSLFRIRLPDSGRSQTLKGP